MPPKEKKTKKPKKTVPKKRRTKKPTITQIQELPRLPTGFNRDIPMGGAGGSSNLLAALASRPPPPATPIQTPDQFQILREQSRQAKVIDLVIEEQEASRRGRPTDAVLAQRLGTTVEQLRADRLLRRAAGFSTMPLEQTRLSDMAGSITEPLSQPMPQESYDPLTPSPNIKKASRGRKAKITGDLLLVPPDTAPPNIGTGATFAGGAPVRQQGLDMTPDGRLRGAVYDRQEIGADTDTTVFMG